MALIDRRNVLKGLLVREAMRRQVIRLPGYAPLVEAINRAIKYKVNALLITADDGRGLGVASKTDLMGAYYADLPLDTPVEAIMTGPPQFCRADDSLDAALEQMRTLRIHRLYVEAEKPGQVQGVLAYPDIVGLLYRFCHKCEKSLFVREGAADPGLADRFRVREVMTTTLHTQVAGDSLVAVMEGLAAQRLGAVLIRGEAGEPLGVVSKTDLITAYRHGLPAAATPAEAVMSTPVQACDQEEWLAAALQKMIFFDLHRLFVYKEEPQNLVGVLSLTDAARFRSGTCRACLPSRIKVG